MVEVIPYELPPTLTSTTLKSAWTPMLVAGGSCTEVRLFRVFHCRTPYERLDIFPTTGLWFGFFG